MLLEILNYTQEQLNTVETIELVNILKEDLKEISEKILLCYNLKKLTIHNEDSLVLEWFIPILPKLTSLEELDLGYNNFGSLTAVNLQDLGAALLRIPQLKRLNLTAINLHTLNLQCFTILCNILPKLVNLKILRLAFNPLGFLTEQALNILGTTLINCSKLEELDLEHTSDSLPQEDCSEIYTAISQIHSLKVLYMNRNSLGYLWPKSFALFCDSLKQCSNLTVLYLNRNGLHSLDDILLKCLWDSIADLSLQKLSLQENFLIQDLPPIQAMAQEIVCGPQEEQYRDTVSKLKSEARTFLLCWNRSAQKKQEALAKGAQIAAVELGSLPQDLTTDVLCVNHTNRVPSDTAKDQHDIQLRAVKRPVNICY